MRIRERIPWINPFYVEHEEIQSDLAPAECLAGLRESMVSRYSPRTWFFANEAWPVIGRISGTTFWMQRIHTFVRPWSLQQAAGAVEPLGSGSVIRLRVGMKLVNAILHVTLGTVVLLTALVAALLFPVALAPWPPFVWAVWPLAAFVAYSIDRLWWAGDAAYLRGFVTEVVGTRRQPWRPYASAETTLQQQS